MTKQQRRRRERALERRRLNVVEWQRLLDLGTVCITDYATKQSIKGVKRKIKIASREVAVLEVRV